MDFRKLLDDLSQKATQAAKDFQLDERIEQGKDYGAEVIEKIKTDRSAQIKAGGGALLLAMLLGTRGGRNIVRTSAKVGAVAGLGALAYRAWLRKSGHEVESEDSAGSVGFVNDDEVDEAFAEALIRTMVAAAWADGALDQAEHGAIASALEQTNENSSVRRLLLNEESEAENLAKISKAARSPNHAAQLYAAAAIVTGDTNVAEAGFLARLSEGLGIEPGHASAISLEALA